MTHNTIIEDESARILWAIFRDPDCKELKIEAAKRLLKIVDFQLSPPVVMRNDLADTAPGKVTQVRK